MKTFFRYPLRSLASGTSLADSKPRSFRPGVFLLCILLVTVVACASTPKKRSFGEVVDDSMITNRLKVKFMKDKVVKAHEIDIDTWKGIVSLKGGVDSQKQINRAIEISERQRGVRQVKSYLVIEDKPWTNKKSNKSSASKASSGGNKVVVEEKDVKNTNSGGIVHDDESEGTNSSSPVVYH